MQMISQRIAGIATGGVERRKAVLSGKRIVSIGYRSRSREQKGINAMAVLIKSLNPVSGSV